MTQQEPARSASNAMGTPRDPLGELRKRAHILDRLLDERGRVARWPARRAQQLIVLDYIAAQLDEGRVMNERELGDFLETVHAFHDAALIRRELVDLGVLERKRDGSSYWKVADAGDAERWAVLEGPNGRRRT